jgi:lactoylglutathione lyase
MVMDFFSIASRINRSVSSRISCLDIVTFRLTLIPAWTAPRPNFLLPVRWVLAKTFLLPLKEKNNMKYLHTMLRVRNLDEALHFYVDLLGLKEARRRVDEKNKYTLVFLYAPEDEALVEESKKKTGRDQPMVELTYNWNTEDYGEARYFGHLAYEVDDIYATCEKLMKGGVTINRPPRDGNMAFVRSPDKHSIELLQKGQPLPPKEPWASMPNTGHW